MKGKLIDLTVSMDGKQRLQIELDGDFRQAWDELHEFDCEVSVKKYRKKRSNEANSYAWVLIGKIAEKMRVKKTDVYRNAIREIGGVSEMLTIKKVWLRRFTDQWESNGIGWQVEALGSQIPGWTNIIAYYGSSQYDTKQMSDLIEILVQDARSLGIETMRDEEIDSLIKEYDNYVKSHRHSRETD